MASEGDAFVPSEELLTALVALGYPRAKAEEALFCTENESLDAAVNFLLTNEGSSGEESSDEEVGTHKMIFVVNVSLGMSIGKVAAQVAHACLKLYRSLMEKKDMDSVVKQWENTGEKKVVLKGTDHVHLNQLYQRAVEENIPCELIHDAGRTEIPQNAVTVLSLFGSEIDVNGITGSLTLLH